MKRNHLSDQITNCLERREFVTAITVGSVGAAVFGTIGSASAIPVPL